MAIYHLLDLHLEFPAATKSDAPAKSIPPPPLFPVPTFPTMDPELTSVYKIVGV